MAKTILRVIIVLGILTVGGLLTYRVSLSRDTAPDRLIAYVVDKDIRRTDSNARGDKKVTALGDVYTIFDQRPDGSVLFGRQNGPELQHTDTTFKTSLWLLQPNGQVEELGQQDVMDAQFFPHGQDILYGTDALDVFIRHANGYTEQVTSKASHPKISPDGKWLVYQKMNSDWQPGEYFDGSLGIMKINLSTKEETQMTDNWEDFDPQWSPDGSLISFSSGRMEVGGVWFVNADGSHLRQITNVGQTKFDPDTTLILPNHPPIWSADGRYLVYESDRQIWSLTVDAERNNLVAAKKIAFGEAPTWLDENTIGVLAAPQNQSSPKILKVRLDGNIAQ